MKTFIQTASMDELRVLGEAGLVDGVALSILDLLTLDDSIDPHDDMALRDRITDIGREFAIPICVPALAVAGDDIYRVGRELAKLSEHVVVQIPFVEDAVIPIRRLVADGVRVCVTYVYSGAQAYLSGKIGATIVMVPIDDLDAHGHPSSQIVGEIRRVIDHAGLECELGVSAPSGSTHFTGSLLAGADISCMTPTVMRSLTRHALTDRGVDRFMNEVSKRHHRPRGV
jgi:transaldolase